MTNLHYLLKLFKNDVIRKLRRYYPQNIAVCEF